MPHGRPSVREPKRTIQTAFFTISHEMLFPYAWPPRTMTRTPISSRSRTLPLELISRLLLFKHYRFRQIGSKEQSDALSLRAVPTNSVRESIPLLSIQRTGLLGDARKVIAPTCVLLRWLSIPLCISIGRKTCLGWLYCNFHRDANFILFE